MKIGIRESDARQLIQSALLSAGLKDVFVLTLFGGESLIVYQLVILIAVYSQTMLRSLMAVVPIVCSANTTTSSLIVVDPFRDIRAT